MAIATQSFDTLGYAKKAKQVGFSEQQAEFQAEALFDLINEKLVTKQDVEEAKRELKQDIEEAKRELKQGVEGVKQGLAELKNEFKDMELRLTIKLGTFMAIAVGLMAVLQKIL